MIHTVERLNELDAGFACHAQPYTRTVTPDKWRSRAIRGPSGGVIRATPSTAVLCRMDPGSGAGVTNENVAMLRVGDFDAKGVFMGPLV